MLLFLLAFPMLVRVKEILEQITSFLFVCLFVLQFLPSTQHFELLCFKRGNFVICKSITLCFLNAFVNKKAKPDAFPFMILE